MLESTSNSRCNLSQYVIIVINYVFILDYLLGSPNNLDFCLKLLSQYYYCKIPAK